MYSVEAPAKGGIENSDESGGPGRGPQGLPPRQDVKLQIVNNEGYDAHDFNLFDDRSSVLWRKPYVDGAVRELTSGDTRSQEQMRQLIERMMLASGTTNPDVRYTTRKAHRSRANVVIDADVDDEQDLLTDIRRNREAYEYQVPSPSRT
jgi:hypothetical protein